MTGILFRLRRSCAWAIACAVCFSLGGAIADDSSPYASLTEKIVETSVASDQISAWTKRGWRAMPRDEFEALKKAAAVKPGGEIDSVWVEKAEYSATFVDGELRDGTLSATVAGNDSRGPELLSLEPLNVALSDVIWSDGSKAVWGVAPDGRSLVWVDRNRGQFRGRWKLNGRPFSRGYRFDIQCAPAAVSRIHLRLPEGWVLSSTVGDVSDPQAPGEQGLHDWLVELGSETSCRLNVVRIAEASTSRSLVFVNTDVSHAMRTDGLQVDARFDIEVLEAPTSRFVFSLPPEFRIISVTYGRDEPVSWTSGLVDGAQQLIVELPDALSGHGRPIRIGGNLPPPSDDRWVLPTPKLLNSTLISGKEQLRIEPPLELQSFEKIEGYKHDTTLVNPSQGSSYTFIRNRDAAEMVVRTGRPRLDLDARVVNYFDATRQTWYLTSQVEWIARSGSTYSAACSLPPQWEPTQVVPRSPEDRSQISQWRILRSADGTRFVLIEFKDALTPEHPKSVRIVCERAPAGSQQLAALPTLQPRDCVVVDSVVVVSHNSKVTPHLEAAANVERIDEAALPEFVGNSPLWKEISATNANRLLLMVKGSVSGQSTLIMENSEPGFEADAQTTLDLHSGDFVETFVATVTPKSEPVKRLLVYLTQTGMQPSWQAFTEPEAQVSATRVSVAQHSAWNLPLSGELWELQLSRSQDKPFRIVGSRKSLIATTPRVTLMLLPSAEVFRGSVELRTANDLNVDVTADNLRSAEPKVDPASDAISRWVSRTWNYESATALLEVGLPGAKSTVDPNVWGEVELQTILADAGHDSDRHRAVFRITTASSPSPLNFRMPNEARLVSVQINGRVVTPSRQGPEFTLLTTGNESNVVEILYETRKSTGLLFDRHLAPMPLSSCKVLYCTWRLAIPPETRLTGTSETILVDRDTENVSWSQRFFGPLGRRQQENLFNPFSAGSWQSLVALFVPNADDLPDAPSQGVPANYVIVRGRAPGSMQSVSFKTWSGFRSSCLGWIVLATSAVITLVLRRPRIDGRARGWLVWISMLVLVAAVAPAPFTAMTGGALTGTLIALLLPRATFLRRPIFVPRKNVISLGSTATFGQASHVARLLIFAAGLTTVASVLNCSLRVDGQEQSVADSDDFRVLVSGNGQSSAKDGESIVYVSARLIDGLRAASNQSHHQPAYLLSTAEYQGKVEDQSYVTLEAMYRIVVLSSSPVTRVFLPVSNANLGGENACLVNGKPQPIYLAKGGDGYEVELFHSDRPVVARKPASTNAETSAQTSSSDNDRIAAVFSAPEQFDVQLKLRPAATRIAGGAQFSSRIPTATGAQVNLDFDKLYASVVVAGDEGEVASDQKESKVQAHLGKSSQLNVSWSTSARQIISPVTMEAGVSCLVEVHPAWLGYRYHVDYRVLSGQVDFIHWQIPTRAIVRSVDSNSLGLNHFHERSSGDSKLLIDLAEPQRGAFSIDAYLIVPIESTGSEFQVPAPEIIEKSDSGKILMNQIGVTAPADFVLSAKTVESNDIARISGESFASSAHFDAFNARTPLYAYRLQAASVLTFDLAPEPTLRKVRQAQTGRISGRDIEWEFSADVEVTGRPAFEHTLIVDPSLRIESISVQEDKAERLLRPSVSGDRIHLFLSDETSGTQHIQLRGRASLQLPATNYTLPLVRIEDVKTVDATLTLLRQSDVSVELSESASLEPVLNADATRPTVAGEVLVGKYRCNLDGPSPQMKVLRKGDHVRVDTATLVKRLPGGSAELSFAMAFRRSAAVVPNLRLSIPPDLAAVYRLSYTNAESKPEKHLDGSVELVFTPGPDSTKDVVAVVAADVTPPTDSWQIPRVSPLDADKGANYLLTSPPDAYAPEENSTSRIVPETLPSWIREATSFDGKTSTWNVYSGDGSQWTLKKASPTNNSNEIRVPLVSTECWWERNGELAGRTEIFVIAEGSRDLALRMPRDTRIGTLVVDGQMAIAKAVDSSQLILNLGSSSKTHVVVLAWSHSSGAPLPEFGEVEAMIPRLANVKPERSLCAIAPPEGRTLITKSGSKHLESLVAWVSRLEGLVAVMWESGSGDPLQSSLWQLVIDTRNTCTENFKLLGRPVDRRSSSAELHERFQSVQEEIKRLQGSFGPSAEKSSPDRSRAPAAVLGVPHPVMPWNPNLMLSDATDMTEHDSLSFLIFRDQWVAYALCAFGLLVVPMCLLKFTRAGYAERLYRRSAILWQLCGVLWWTCLTMSVLGMFLFAIATFFLIGRRTRSMVG